VRGADEFKTGRARRLRSVITDAEGALWYQLRSRRLNGFKFVRQEPLGPYTVDFICRERRLIVEADGSQNADSSEDKVRDAWLSNHNYRVLRFWNHEILGNMAGVLEIITTARQDNPPHSPR
jgi:very-short-patch-repair endonuclease